MQILYVDKSELEKGQFGVCTLRGGVPISIKIRKDLPQCVKDFLLSHEELHGDDILNNEGLMEKELESTWGGFIRHPLGAILTALMSLSPGRLKYYYQRLKAGV